MITIEKIRNVLLNPTIDLIVSQPAHKIIHSIHLNLNANAAFIHSHLIDRFPNVLPPTVTSAVYNTILKIPFIAPSIPAQH